MAGESVPVPRRDRANWVALRTLRQVPKVVGRTRTGDPIFEIRSVRLVLPHDRSHFLRLVACAKCGGDVVGAAVLTPADLDHPSHAVLCRECVRSAVAPVVDSDELTGALPLAEDAEPDVADDARSDALPSRPWETLVEGAGRRTTAQQSTAHDESGLVGDGLGLSSGVEGARWETLERQTDEAVERLSARLEAKETELRATLAAHAERLHATLEDRARPTGTVPALTAPDTEEPVRAHDEMGRRMGLIGERLAHEAETNRRRYDALEGRLLELQVDPRAPDSGTDTSRLEALERQVHEAVGRLTEMVESQGMELGQGLRDGLDEVRSAITVLANRSASRLDDLEDRAAKADDEVSQLVELQPVLDGGLGQLRTQMGALREAAKALAAGQAALDRRLQALVQAQLAAAGDQGRGRRLGAKSAQSGAHMAAVSATTDGLVLEREQLEAQLAMLEESTGDAAGTAAGAASEDSALAPLRSDVRALAEQLAAQNEEVAALSRSVERLRRKVTAELPPAKPASKASKASPRAPRAS